MRLLGWGNIQPPLQMTQRDGTRQSKPRFLGYVSVLLLADKGTATPRYCDEADAQKKAGWNRPETRNDTQSHNEARARGPKLLWRMPPIAPGVQSVIRCTWGSGVQPRLPQARKQSRVKVSWALLRACNLSRTASYSPNALSFLVMLRLYC